MSVEQNKVAVVGLGNMGSAILRRISLSGPVTGFDIESSRREAIRHTGTATIIDDIQCLAGNDVIILSLPSPRVSERVISSLVDFMPRGLTIIETSTVSPEDVLHARTVLEKNGGRLIDAAVFSGVQGMLDGTAKLLVGGITKPEDDPITHVLRRIAGDLMYFPDPGAGMAAKVINNAVAHATMVVLVEAAGLAAAYGIDGDSLTELLSGPEGGVIRPLVHRYVERIRNGDYEGGMPTAAALKDSRLALDMAQKRGVPLFAMQSSHTVYEVATASGKGSQDYSSIATLWEEWQGTSFSSKQVRGSEAY